MVASHSSTCRTSQPACYSGAFVSTALETDGISLTDPASLELPPAPPPKQRLYLAFAAIYFVWGSTYLAIFYAIRTIPPFFMAGTRFLLAGLLLFLWSRLKGIPPPTRPQWRSASIVGALLFLGGNGALSWGERRVPSGLAALLLSTIPLWMVLLGTFRFEGDGEVRFEHRHWLSGTHLSTRVIAGLVAGLTGIGLLVGPTDLLGHGRVDSLGAAVLLGGAFSWAVGSLISRPMALPASTLMAAAIEMTTGGVMLIILGFVAGESRGFHLDAVSQRSLFGLIYLIVFGSLIGFTSYNWLLTHSTPARISTYAYVNPVVAVFLGWLLAGEHVTLRTLLATLVVVSAVALIVTHRPHPASDVPIPQPEASPSAIPPE